jgi:hypothetical protein
VSVFVALIAAGTLIVFFLVRGVLRLVMRSAGYVEAASAAIIVGTILAIHAGSVALQTRTTAPLLRSNGLSANFFDVTDVCRHARGGVERGGHGSIDVFRADRVPVANGGSISARAKVVLAGWGVDVAATRPASAICLVVDGKLAPAGFAFYGIPRPDVVRSLDNGTLGPSGFVIQVVLARFGRGMHAIGAATLSRDGTLQQIGRATVVRVV